MRKNRIKILVALFVSAVVFQANYIAWGATSLIKTKEYEIEAKDKKYQKDHIFDDVIIENGKLYKLKDITYDLKEEKPVMKKEVLMLSITSDAILATEKYVPEDKWVDDGVTFSLESTSKQETQIASDYTQLVTGEDTYDYEVSQNAVPATKKVKTIDQQTNEEVEVICQFVSLVKGNDTNRTMTFPVTYYNYNSDFYSYGGGLIPYSDEKPALDGYERQLLEEAGYSPAEWTITDIVWSGDAYDNNGVLQRDAIATCIGSQVHYTAKYEGVIKREAVKGYYYTSLYKGEKEVSIQGTKVYKVVAKAKYELPSDKKTLSTTQKVLLGLGVIAFATGVIFMFYILSKKEKEKKVDG